MAASGAGLYCSTSNTTFESEEALREHYKSDWHRYNLKRKVAGLPPVTREWFESRRAALQAATAAPSQEASTWICQLTGKKFKNEATYKAFTESKKYKDALRKAGGVALPPLVRSRHTKTPEEIEDKRQRQREKAELEKQARAESAGMPLADEEHEDEDEESEWETDEEADPDVVRDELMREQEDDHDAMAVEWDPRRCLFSNHMSESVEANLTYMMKTYGFFVPDAEALCDPQGLVKYLGWKISVAKIPLNKPGNVRPGLGRQFRSLQAVQRHMIDSGQCRMLYDDNEEEYEDYYDYSQVNAQEDEMALVSGVQEPRYALHGYEMVVGGSASGSKTIGSRQLAQYYKQRVRPRDTRDAVVANQVVLAYRNMGVVTRPTSLSELQDKRVQQVVRRQRGLQLKISEKVDKICDLPKNVPY